MTAKKTDKPGDPDVSTEEKIKRAALKLFARHGYAATRTRDISAEAGINVALLNYYFRSKEKLFEMLMTEILKNFFSGLITVLNDEETSLEEKVAAVVSNYSQLLGKQPDLPLFILSEIRARPGRLAARLGLHRILESYFFVQVRRHSKKRNIDPLQHLINLIALCVFPFIAAPLIRQIGGLDDASFQRFVHERERSVPTWMEAILNVNAK